MLDYDILLLFGFQFLDIFFPSFSKTNINFINNLNSKRQKIDNIHQSYFECIVNSFPMKFIALRFRSIDITSFYFKIIFFFSFITIINKMIQTEYICSQYNRFIMIL